MSEQKDKVIKMKMHNYIFPSIINLNLQIFEAISS